MSGWALIVPVKTPSLLNEAVPSIPGPIEAGWGTHYTRMYMYDHHKEIVFTEI
jgi:hypothetical protein